MGFRNKHRRGRGGGGGGGGGGGHHHHQHHGFGTGEPNGLQPGDDLGNRKSFKVVQQPPDDLGNRKDPEEAEWIPLDDVGNRIEAAPTHEVSGVLLEMGGKNRRGRRPKGVSAPERVGRFVVGGVNPLIATTTPRAFPGKTLDESYGNGSSGGGMSTGGGAQHASNDDGYGDHVDTRPADGGRAPREPREPLPPREPREAAAFPDSDFESDGQGGRRRRRRGRGRDSVDGVQAQEVSERRAQRFFDFEEDDRFDYTLKTTAEQKRKDAEDAVRSVVVESGRDATVLARLIEDGTRPKILVTIDERGPAASLPPERRAANAGEPLFVMGNAALMSLNYLVNKIVNRYPDDRIRLAILPAADERLYVDALAEHQKVRRTGPAPTPAARAPEARGHDVPSEIHNGLEPVLVPQPSVSKRDIVATPVPVGPAAPPEAFDAQLEKPRAVEKPKALEEAEAQIADRVKHIAERPEAEKLAPPASPAPEEAVGEDEDDDEEEEADEDEDAEAAAPAKKKAAPKKKAKAVAKKAPAKKAPVKKAKK